MWTMDIGSAVLSKLRSKGTKALVNDYPNINFTDSDRAPSTPKFPTVYYHEISSPETGQTLDGASLNGMLYSVQIEVTDNGTTSLTTKTVMSKVVDIMKEMRFQVVGTPEFQNTQNVFRMVARFRRTIGYNDVI